MAELPPNVPTPMPTAARGKGHATLMAALVILLVASLAGNVYLWLKLGGLGGVFESDDTDVTEAQLTASVPLGVDGSYVSRPGPGTVENATHGFSFTYPAGMHAVTTAGEHGLPVAFLDSQPIQVPLAWDFQLTPVEFRVIPVTEAATIDEAAAQFREVLSPASVQETRVTTPYGGIKLTGVLEVDGSQLGTYTYYFFQLFDGVLQVSYLHDGAGVTEAQLNEVIQTLSISGPDA